jgi:hypothetical protein
MIVLPRRFRFEWTPSCEEAPRLAPFSKGVSVEDGRGFVSAPLSRPFGAPSPARGEGKA